MKGQYGWYEAFAIVDRAIANSGDDELVKAWQAFLKSPFPQLSDEPVRGLTGERVNVVGRFLREANEWNGRGVELLLFRMIQALENLQTVFETMRAPATASPTPAPTRFPDEYYQPSYCDDCGGELDLDGDCLNCITKTVVHHGK